MYGRPFRPPVVDAFLELISKSPLPISLKWAARELAIGRSHLQHLLREHLNRTFRDCLREEIARRAAHRIVGSPHMSLASVAESLNLDERTMARYINRVFGCSPSELRRKPKPDSPTT